MFLTYPFKSYIIAESFKVFLGQKHLPNLILVRHMIGRLGGRQRRTDSKIYVGKYLSLVLYNDHDKLGRSFDIKQKTILEKNSLYEIWICFEGLVWNMYYLNQVLSGLEERIISAWLYYNRTFQYSQKTFQTHTMCASVDQRLSLNQLKGTLCHIFVYYL